MPNLPDIQDKLQDLITCMTITGTKEQIEVAMQYSKKQIALVPVNKLIP